MFQNATNWLRSHGTIILVLIFGLLGSLILVWWRLGFTLEFFQPQAAQPCSAGDSCGGHGCGSGGLCNKCGFPGASGAQADADCAGLTSRACEEAFCVSEGKGFNHCVVDDSSCSGGGGPAPPPTQSAKAVFSLTNVGWTPGACDSASSLGGNAGATVRVSDAGNVNTHIVWNIFRSDTAGCSATNEKPSSGGTRTGKCDFSPHQGGDCRLNYNIGANNCGRVQLDAAFSDGAFSDGASGVFIGQVINYGVDCADVSPPTHTECQNNACVSVSGSGNNQCSSNADCGGTQPQTHSVCQNNACVEIDGAGTDECATNAECTTPTHLVCENNACVEIDGAGTDECATNAECTSELVCLPATQDVGQGDEAAFTATGGTGTYSWQTNGGSPSTGSDPTFKTTYDSDGSYTVTVTSGSDTADCEVNVTSEPQSPVCDPETQGAEIGQAVDIVANGGSGNYAWSAPDGDPASGSMNDFNVSFDTDGTFDVLLRDTETQETDVCQVVVEPAESPPMTTILEEPGLRIRKTVRNITQGGSEADSVGADPRDTVEFIIEVRSTGKDVALDVVAQDNLPSRLTYISGTTEIDGDDAPDTFFSSGLELGDMDPGDEFEIRFRARVDDEDEFDDGTTVLTNRASAEGSNTSKVSDVAFVTVTKDPANPVLAIRKFGRNVTRNEVGERSSVVGLPNHTIEFTIRVENVSITPATNVIVQDVVPQGVVFQSGTVTLNGQPSSDLLVTTGVNIGTLDPGEEAVVRFLGKVAPANQLPEGTTTLINVARTWSDNVPPIMAQLPVIIVNSPIDIPPVDTGPGETTALALIISAIVTLMYIGYTSTDTFRRREVAQIAGEKRDDDFTGSHG